MDLNSFKMDTAKLAGTWIEYGDASFLIASANSPEYKKDLRKRVSKIPQHLLRASPEIAEKVTADCMAKFILLDWKGLTEGGKELKPTPENRRQVLEVQALLDWVAEQALNIANFQSEDEADDVAAVKSKN